MRDIPLLSICIPTYNRADCLKKCLDAIVTQDGFNEKVEIVISDNLSSDETEKVGKEFQEKFSNIHYFRNEKNVLDMNYPLVFQRAKGKLRKLTNDTIIYSPGAIQYMCDLVEKYEDRKPQIYFSNGIAGVEQEKEVLSLEQYIDILNYHLTWIGSVAIWDEDCENLNTFIDNVHTRLGQVPLLLENIEKRGSAVICNQCIMEWESPQKKDLSYGLYKVFYVVFLGYLKEYLNAGKISRMCFENVRRLLLFDFFCKWIVRWKMNDEKYIFGDEKLDKLVEKAYKDTEYYAEYKRKLFSCRIKTNLRKIIPRIRDGKE